MMAETDTTLDTGTSPPLVQTELDKRAVATEVPEGVKLNLVEQKIKDDELMAKPTELGSATLAASQVPTDNLEVAVPQTKVAEKYTAQTITGTPTAVAAQGKVSSESVIGDIVGTVGEKSVVEAAQGQVSEKATVQYQIGELFKSFEEGKPAPAWAAPAMRAVGAVMQSRGLGASSMASAAITQAMVEAGIPIAKMDADKYSQMDLANLNNQQQAVMQNALTYAAMDKANLDARMQVAVNNAKSFLTIDLQDLTNQQKVQEINYAGELQRMTTNAAAENVSRQFNAQSQNQVDEFFADLGAQIESTNKNRVASQNQFNVNEANATSEFISSQNNQREQFNVQMAAQIDQSNAVWRREINTANTANQNAINQTNAQNLLGINQSALNALWMKYRDEAGWAFKIGQDAEQRYHEIGLLGMETSGNASLYNKQTATTQQTELGKAILNGLFNIKW